MRNIIFLGFTLCLYGCASWFQSPKETKVEDVVYSHNARLSYCYKKALQENNELEGQMQFGWDVDYRSGQERIRNVSVEHSEISSETLANCMKKVISSMRFDLRDRNEIKVQRVSYPFHFSNDKASSLTE